MKLIAIRNKSEEIKFSFFLTAFLMVSTAGSLPIFADEQQAPILDPLTEQTIAPTAQVTDAPSPVEPMPVLADPTAASMDPSPLVEVPKMEQPALQKEDAVAETEIEEKQVNDERDNPPRCAATYEYNGANNSCESVAFCPDGFEYDGASDKCINDVRETRNPTCPSGEGGQAVDYVRGSGGLCAYTPNQNIITEQPIAAAAEEEIALEPVSAEEVNKDEERNTEGVTVEYWIGTEEEWEEWIVGRQDSGTIYTVGPGEVIPQPGPGQLRIVLARSRKLLDEDLSPLAGE